MHPCDTKLSTNAETLHLGVHRRTRIADAPGDANCITTCDVHAG